MYKRDEELNIMCIIIISLYFNYWVNTNRGTVE